MGDGKTTRAREVERPRRAVWLWFDGPRHAASGENLESCLAFSLWSSTIHGKSFDETTYDMIPFLLCLLSLVDSGQHREKVKVE